MTVGTGSTGVSLLQDYSIRTSELKYFIDYCKNTPVAKLSFQGLAPNEEMGRIAERVRSAYEGVLEKIPRLEKDNPTPEDISKVRETIEDLYSLLQGMYTTVTSGRTIL